ncbi:MAG TPA: DUF692 domain-containing protein, partial [Turneriella sp.]|nr:DUF692 domain-containing protein [Turneriella sp.]
MLGVGLRAKHFPYLAKHKANVDFFEVLSENYIDTEGYPREVVRRLRRDYKMCMHGVSLSMGSATGVNNAYLKKLKQLADEIEPFLISDHLCFTGVKRENSHDLLPLPFTMRMVDIVVRNIDTVQNFLKTRIALENVSSYLTWRASEMSEWDFINTIVQKSGCKILLDINNVYVNAKNHGYNADDFLTRINPTHVGEIHIAGYSDMGTHLFDTHAEPVHAPVLELWKKHAARFHKIPMIVERDDAIPAFHVVEREVLRLGKIRENAYIKERKNRIVMEVFLPPRVPEKRNNADVGKLQKVFLEGIQNQNFASLAQVKGGGKLSDKAALKVYHAGWYIHTGRSFIF